MVNALFQVQLSPSRFDTFVWAVFREAPKVCLTLFPRFLDFGIKVGEDMPLCLRSPHATKETMR